MDTHKNNVCTGERHIILSVQLLIKTVEQLSLTVNRQDNELRTVENPTTFRPAILTSEGLFFLNLFLLVYLFSINKCTVPIMLLSTLGIESACKLRKSNLL